MIAGSLEIQLLANMARLRTDMNSANQTVRKSMQDIENKVESAKRVLGTLGVGLSVGILANKFKQVAVETDRLRGNLVTVTGSTEAAAAAFDNLTRFASTTPFTLDQSVNAFIKLKALGLDPSERALNSYGNTAAAMGKDMNQMIEAVADASTNEFERLKEFGIKAKQQGDEVSFTFQGITTTVGKNSKEIQEYLLGIGETKFGDAMANQMERLPGKLSNLEDNVDALFRKLGDEGGINLFGSGIETASGLVVGLTESIDSLVAGVEISGIGFGVWREDVSAGLRFIDKEFETMFSNINSAGLNVSEILSLTISTTLINIKSLIAIAAVEAGAAIDTLELRVRQFRLRDAQDTYKLLSGLGLRNSAWAQEQLKIFEELSGDLGMGGYQDQLAAIDRARVRTIGEIIDSNQDATRSVHEMVFAAQQARLTFEEFIPVAHDTAEAIEEGAEAAETFSDKEKDLIAKLQQKIKALGLSAREQAILTEVTKLGSDANQEAIDKVTELAGRLYDEAAAAQSVNLELEVQRNMVENLQREWANLLRQLADGKADVGDFFDAWAKGLAEIGFQALAADGISLLLGGGGGNLAGLFGGGKGSSGTNAGNTALSAAGLFSGGGLSFSGIASGVGGFAEGLFGFGQGAANFMGPMTQSATMGANFASLLTSGPGLAIAAALAGKLIHDATNDPDGFHRGVFGFFGSDTPGADPNSTFQVSPFSSGFRPLGYADGPASIADANRVIEQYRFIDQAVFDAVSRIPGAAIDTSRATFGGFGLDGIGAGTLFGGSQRTSDAQLRHQLNEFSRQLGLHISGLTPDALAKVAGASSAQELIDVLERLADSTDKAAEGTVALAGGIDVNLANAMGPTLQQLEAGRRAQEEQQQREEAERIKAAEQSLNAAANLLNPQAGIIPEMLEAAREAGIDLSGTHYADGRLIAGQRSYEEQARRDRVERNLERIASGYNPVTGTYSTIEKPVEMQQQGVMGLTAAEESLQLLRGIYDKTAESAKKLRNISENGLEVLS